MPLDILYPVRDGESNDELRYSLRSLANLPHGRVWFVGHKPAWVKNVEYIEGGNSSQHTRANLYNNLLLACRSSEMPEDFIVFNDDFYVIGPIESVPVLYRGSLSEQVGRLTKKAGLRGWWQESLIATLACLQAAGYTDPVSYELHVPFPIRKAAMAQTLERFAAVTPHNPPQWRTLYGVEHAIGGTKGTDGKAHRPGPLARPFHSTDDLSWRYFRQRFMQLFPQPSPYEVPIAQPRGLAPATARPLSTVVTRQTLRARPTRA